MTTKTTTIIVAATTISHRWNRNPMAGMGGMGGMGGGMGMGM